MRFLLFIDKKELVNIDFMEKKNLIKYIFLILIN